MTCRFLDKTGRTGSRIQLVNGLLLLSTFFGVRLVYGSMLVRTVPVALSIYLSLPYSQSYGFLCTLAQVRDQISVSYVIVYGLGNIVLQGLNWLWFVNLLGYSPPSSSYGL